MKKCLQHIFFFLLSAFCFQLTAHNANAQQSVFIPPSAHIFSHPEDTISIFGNVLNEGNFGSAPGSVINFTGVQWQNTPLSLMPGNTGINTPGGLFRFTGTKEQSIAGGYNFSGKTGPSFPNISIENKAGLKLEDLNDLHIRGSLHFSRGYLFLNGWNTLVNDSVTGYSEKGFVVTGAGIGGGQLYLNTTAANNQRVFPIGTETDSYSPLAIQSSEPFNSVIGARVFDHVYEHAINDKIIDSDYVKKTWQLTAAQGKPQTTILLQHNEDEEGVRFTPFHDSSYISHYSITASKWDLDKLPHDVQNPGTLTTGKPRNNSFVNDRMFPGGIPNESADSVSWLSVSTKALSDITCPLVDFQLWAAQRYSYQYVQLFWRTLRELNVQTYEVQRRRDTSQVFRTIATFDSKGNNGFSNHKLYYYYSDDNTYNGYSYYRLKITSASGCVVYNEVRDVPWRIGVEVWPNPTPGETHIRVNGIKHALKMQLIDTWGQILKNYTIERDGVYDIDLRDLSDATYFLVFYDPAKGMTKVTTVKLVVQRAQ